MASLRFLLSQNARISSALSHCESNIPHRDHSRPEVAIAPSAPMAFRGAPLNGRPIVEEHLEQARLLGTRHDLSLRPGDQFAPRITAAERSPS
jgi:hypothetical protein